jgi:hypothetical protein
LQWRDRVELQINSDPDPDESNSKDDQYDRGVQKFFHG